MANGNERQQEMTAAAAAAAAAANEFPAGMRVLAVDDDSVCLKVLEAVLRRCKYNVLSADEEEASVVKRISTGVCDYLVKLVNIKELKNIWQHVVRRRIPNPRVQPIEISEGECIAAKSKSTEKKKCSGRRICGEDNVDENEKNKHLSTKKNPRITWTSELHGRFLQAINQIGINSELHHERSHCKPFAEVPDISKKVCGYTGGKSYPFDDSFESRNSYHDMNEYGSSSSSSNLFPRMNSPSHFGAHNLQLPAQSFHLRNPQSSLGMGPVVPGDSTLNDARKLPPLGLHADSFINISDDTMMDDDEFEDSDNESPACYPGNSYANILRNKLLEASKGIPGDSFEDMTSGATMSMPVNKLPVQSVALSVPVNQFPVQSPQLRNQHSVQMNCTLTGTDSYSQDIVGNCSRSRQNVVPTELPTSWANIREINRLARVAPPPSQIPMLQDQPMALTSNPPAPTAVLGETMLPYNIEDNTSSMDMVDGNFAAGGASSINPSLSGLEIDSFLALTPMLNDEGAVGSPPLLRGVVDQLDYSNQAPDGQINYNNDCFVVITCY